MPKRPCSICSRPDIEHLVECVKNGASARHIAQKNGIHPRVFQQCLARHRANPLGRQRASRAGHAARAAIQEKVNASAEAQALLQRAGKILAAAEADGSHRLALDAIRESKGIVDLLARLNGELSAPGVNVMVGVNVDRAKQAVELVEVAESLPPEALADRAIAFLLAYNADHPDDRRSL